MIHDRVTHMVPCQSELLTSLYLYHTASFEFPPPKVFAFQGMSVPSSADGREASQNANEKASSEDRDALQLVIRIQDDGVTLWDDALRHY